MKRMILAGALALAVPQCVHAGPRCSKIGQRFAAKRATVAPVRVVMPFVGRAVIAPVAMVLRATRATCSGPNCGK